MITEDHLIRRTTYKDDARQSWRRQSQWMTDDGRHIQVNIARNFYDTQSEGFAEVFDPVAARWNRVASIPAALLAVCQRHRGVPLVSYMAKELSEDAEAAFDVDEEDLLGRVSELLAVGVAVA